MLYAIRPERLSGFRSSSKYLRADLARARILRLDTSGHAWGTCPVVPTLERGIGHSRRVFGTADIYISDNWRPGGEETALAGARDLSVAKANSAFWQTKPARFLWSGLCGGRWSTRPDSNWRSVEGCALSYSLLTIRSHSRPIGRSPLTLASSPANRTSIRIH